MAEADVLHVLGTINEKLEILLTLKKSVGSIELSVQKLSDKYDEVLKQISKHGNDIETLKQRVKVLEQKENEMEIDKLKHDLNELEWRCRSQNLEIHGVPETANEDLMTKLNEVAQMLDVPQLSANELVSLHRLPSRADKVPGIIARFVSRSTRDLWLENRLKLKGKDGKTHLTENLTKHDKNLLWATKQWAKNNGFKFAWHRNGKTFVRKEGTSAIPISTENDLRGSFLK